MLVVPAIDIAAGKLSRLEEGVPTPVQAFGSDPLEAARSFVSAGARWLHVVDLDLAFGGSVSGLPFLARIAELGVPVQASGGVARLDEAEVFFASGASRVVLGSGALRDRPATEALIAAYGERLVVGIETDGENIRPRGRWSEAPDEVIPLRSVIKWLLGAGARRFLVTQVARVGARAGPDKGLLARVMVAAGGTPVIAAGGIASPEDVCALGGSGIEGVVVGSAIYEGRYAVHEFLAAGLSS